MKILVKDGVVFKEINDRLLKIMKVYDQAMVLLKAEAVITSANDGTHLESSLHYKNLALDLRSRDLTPDKKERLIKELKSELGSQYQVILEKPGEPGEHAHVEFDPNRNGGK